MGVMVYIVLLGWVPLTLALFATMPPRRAVLISFIAAVLFMPVGGMKVPGIPDYSRATVLSILTPLAIVIFDFGRLARFRFKWIDVPMLAFCLVNFFSSIHNGLGAYDGLAVSVHEMLVWGIPYFIGRLYFDDLEGMRELAMGVAVGALIYVPFCLFEAKMSPQLHNWVYGYYQHQFAQTYRWGGFRPVVFMEHGLAVALWMGIGSVMIAWLWITGAVRRILMLPIAVAALVQFVTFLFCRSMGAVMVAAGVLAMLYMGKMLRSRVPVALIAVVPFLYIADRVTGINALEVAVHMAAKVNAERASSLETRLTNESSLMAKALEEPIFGWGGWGRSRVIDEEGEDVSVTDGLWVITLGTSGIIGLAGLLGWQLLPPLLVLRRVRPRAIGSAEAAAPIALSAALFMMAIDALPNAPAAPVYMLISGGLASFAISLKTMAVRASQPAPARASLPSIPMPPAGAPV